VCRLDHCHGAGEHHRFQSISAAELILHTLARGATDRRNSARR
jgi:hypothetical protein